MPDDRIIELALNDYRTGRFKSLNAAARAYNIVPSTLKYRNKKNINRRDSHVQQQLLTPAQEDYFTRWILDMEAVGMAPNHAQLREMASLISRISGGPNQVGKGWLPRFLNRHPDIKRKLGRTIASQRVGSITQEAIQNWYDQLLAVIELKSITLDAIWNMDEMGTAFGYCTHQTVFGSQDTDITYVRRPQDREWCTSIECISCFGLSLTPLIIFKAKHVQQQWFIPENTPDWVYTSSSSAFTTNEIGLKWLQEIFIPQTAEYVREGQWTLLLLDGHKSHITSEFMQLAYLHKIFCYYLIPHASHILQPLDLAVFSSLKRRFRELVAFDASIDDYEPVKKTRFLQLYQEARTKAITPPNCAAGFRAAGINPFDASKALSSKFVIPSTIQRPLTPPPPSTLPESTYNISTTPHKRSDVYRAIQTLQTTDILSRNVRTVLAKVTKAIDREICTVASNQKELSTLRRKVATVAAKSKRKGAVNSNKLFIDLNDIQMGQNSTSRAIPEATASSVAPIASQNAPLASITPGNPFATAIQALLSIRDSTI